MPTPDLRELAEAATDNLPRSTEAEALASLREFALGPMEAVLTWSEAGIVLELVETLTKGGIVEVAIRNPSVADYMQHWEGRAEKAEAEYAALLDERDALRAALADLINAAASMRRHALAIVGADTQDQDAAEAFEMYHDATETLRKTEARARAALSQSTPQTDEAEK